MYDLKISINLESVKKLKVLTYFHLFQNGWFAWISSAQK